ncbi:MAG: hypothetical protein D6714_05845 [Bacteroidetes bacterium]|nr:MAG: hypothetical protein D6714_05845 [Bacteroidota bacterium]
MKRKKNNCSEATKTDTILLKIRTSRIFKPSKIRDFFLPFATWDSCFLPYGQGWFWVKKIQSFFLPFPLRHSPVSFLRAGAGFVRMKHNARKQKAPPEIQPGGAFI